MYYNTKVVTTNLSDAHSVVTDVNTWVSNVTEGNIDRMIEDGKVYNCRRACLKSMRIAEHDYFFREQREGFVDADHECTLLQRIVASSILLPGKY